MTKGVPYSQNSILRGKLYQVLPYEKPVTFDDDKALFLQSARMSASNCLQESWHRIIQNALKGLYSNRTENRLTNHPSSVQDLLAEANRKDRLGETDSGLDLIYDSIDYFMRIGRFSEIDQAISGLDVGTLSTDFLLGILTATLPAKDRLSSRSQFLRSAESALKSRDEYDDGLLSGLE